MGRRSEVSDEEIVQAGLGLVTSKELVTGWALRRALGGKGSPPRLMSVWKAERSQVLHDEYPGGVLPQSEVQEARDGIKAALGFIDRLDGEARDAVRRAEETFERAVETATEEAASRVVDLDADLMLANHSITTLERELRAALNEAASEKTVSAMTREDKLVAEEAATALRQELAELTVKLAVAEERARAALERAEQAEERERASLKKQAA